MSRRLSRHRCDCCAGLISPTQDAAGTPPGPFDHPGCEPEVLWTNTSRLGVAVGPLRGLRCREGVKRRNQQLGTVGIAVTLKK